MPLMNYSPTNGIDWPIIGQYMPIIGSWFFLLGPAGLISRTQIHELSMFLRSFLIFLFLRSSSAFVYMTFAFAGARNIRAEKTLTFRTFS